MARPRALHSRYRRRARQLEKMRIQGRARHANAGVGEGSQLSAWKTRRSSQDRPRAHRADGVLTRWTSRARCYCSFTRFQQTWHPGVEFAAYIPLYASCSIAIIGDTEISTVPIRQFHGAADDYNPVAPCRLYFERLRAAGKDATLTEFPDAHHVFDDPLAPKTPNVLKGAQCVRACALKEEPLGIIINAETGQPFSYADPCVQTGPHIGYNEAAAIATRGAVKELLQTVFRLK